MVATTLRRAGARSAPASTVIQTPGRALAPTTLLRRTWHIAVVHGPRGVYFVSVGRSLDERERDLAGYVRRRAERQLAPRTSARVLGLLRRDEHSAAIREYFDAVGPEWEDEWLHLETLADPRLDGTLPQDLT